MDFLAQQTPPPPKRSPRLLLGLFLFVAGVLLVALAYAANRSFSSQVANLANQTNAGTETQPPSMLPKPTAVAASAFALYEEPSVTVKPAVPAYTVEKDLANVENSGSLNLSVPAAAKPLLEQNAFAVASAPYDEFYPLYEDNRYRSIPSFVTTDSLLHNFHLYYDYLLKTVEEQKLSPALSTLSDALLAGAQQQLTTLTGTAWENAAKRNVAFVSVGKKLLDPAFTVPATVLGQVTQELAAIDAHAGNAEAIIMNMGETFVAPDSPLLEDYSQYVPRGHYTESDALKNYFRAMMWFGRMTFRLHYDDETRSAILLTVLLQDAQRATAWKNVAEPIDFFVGRPDDVAYAQLDGLLTDVYGLKVSLATITGDAAKFADFTRRAQQLEPPQINSIPVFQSSLQPEREEAILGFRLLGQRFTVDASIFQRLLCRDVGTNTGKKECGGAVPGSRMLPKALDIPAAMGSAEALSILKDEGETKYLRYPENMTALQQYLGDLPKEQWTQNLYWGWLYGLLPFTKQKYEGFPSFMRNTAWQRKELNTYLASWTELKHDTLLYAKQAYAELGGGPPEPEDDRGYVEPNPLVFARLAALVKMTRQGLGQRAMLDDASKDDLQKTEDLALSLKAIAEKELANEKLSDADYELIRSYGGQIEHFWLAVNQKKLAASGLEQTQYLQQNPAAIVADVATDPNGFVLEEGTGRINHLFVVVPVEGKLRLTLGGVFSHYEFAQPMSNRLTDEAWRTMLSAETPPAPASWTSSFLVTAP